MRLQHRVELTGGGSLRETLPAFFTHRGGSRLNDQSGRISYEASAVVLVDLPDRLVDPVTADPRQHRITFRGLEWRVTGAQPHYLPSGRLHHTTLELERMTG